MKKFYALLLLLLVPFFAWRSRRTSSAQSKPGILLENLSWQEAESVLDETTVVVIPIGAAAKEHGPHLRLNNDWTLAEYLKNRVANTSKVVIAPTVNYHFYPAFVEYPGSTSLRLETARDLIIDICRSLSKFGPKRFYALNTGVSTVKALEPAAETLAEEGILLYYTDISKATEAVEVEIQEQEGGTHADELETSMMLYIAPKTVQMSKAVKDYSPFQGRLTRDPSGNGTYSPTGSWGDPTLASRDKGEKLIEALEKSIFSDITRLSRREPPQLEME